MAVCLETEELDRFASAEQVCEAPVVIRQGQRYAAHLSFAKPLQQRRKKRRPHLLVRNGHDTRLSVVREAVHGEHAVVNQERQSRADAWKCDLVLPSEGRLR